MENIAAENQLKFPIGPFIKQDVYTEAKLDDLIRSIKEAPALYRKLAESLAKDDYVKTYRSGSWNIKQLYHHVADIQLLHYFRMKKAITESEYTDVTLINIDNWAATADATEEAIEDSLMMLEGITKRYVYLIGSLSDEQLNIEYFHPVRKFTVNQKQAIAMSAWHLKHHLAHIKIALGKSYE